MAEITRLIAQLDRCLQCRKPGCSVACPLHNDCPAIVAAVRSGRFADVCDIVGHPFGGVCGSICPHELQCGGGCVLGKSGHPIQIGQAEAAAYLAHPYPIVRKDNRLLGKKIAVVGGGVSGVTFAAKCYESGADVTVYESDNLLHTLYSVPQFRLPHKLLDDIVAAVERSDITVTAVTVEYQMLKRLCGDNDYVYLSCGATVAYKAGIDGEQYATTADEFLRSDYCGEVIVVGGGNTAMDCAVKNAVCGGNSTIAYRRTMADMPAFEREVRGAIDNGVRFATNLAPLSAKPMPDGKLSVTFAKTISQGRGKLLLTDDKQTLVCDKLVVAAGNAFDSTVFPCEMFCNNTKFVPTDDRGKVMRNLYAGGDCVGGKLVVDAVKHALNAFNGIVSNCRDGAQQ